MDSDERATVPDHVPEEWVALYGRRPSGRGLSPDGGPATGMTLARLVVWVSMVAAIGGVVVWSAAGVAGVVALIVPIVVIVGGGVLVVRWAMRTDRR